ncbi:MAG: AI-2E family transporter [Holosporales bacterium]|jgi:predicted PurR-regulated permease PerM|nr:AI-2E family transporter [Holosporales bacterium]
MADRKVYQTKYVLISILLIGIVALCYAMGSSLIPFVVSLILAYILHVPVRNTSKLLHVSQSVSAGIVVILLITIFTLFITCFIPITKNSLLVLFKKLPILLTSLPDFINDFLTKILSAIGINKSFDIGVNLQNYLSEITKIWPNYLMNIINTSVAMVHSMFFIVIIPILVFYLLKDWDKMTVSIKSILERTVSPTVINLLRSINANLGKYIKSQLLVCCLLAVLYTIGLCCLGLDDYFMCGILSGLLSFAPFFGPLISLFITLVMAIDEFLPHQYILTCCLYVIIPLLDSNFITPKFIGQKIGIPPAWLLFSICASISVLGTMGIFLSIPVAVILATVFKDISTRV